MAKGRRDPGWRDQAAAALFLKHLRDFPLPGPVLVMGEPGEAVPRGIAEAGKELERWDRRALGGRRATAWPPEGPFGTVALRVPRSKEELDMTLHGAAGALEPAGRILVYGAKDEGIVSAAGWMEPLFRDVGPLAVGGHCRVLGGTLREDGPGIRWGLASWKEVRELSFGGVTRSWVTYPGVFARGRLDPGTRLLLEHLPPVSQGAEVLDHGCGSGAIGMMVQTFYPSVRLTLTDIDAVAVEAAKENLPGARLLLSDGLPAGDQGPFDLIVSNPPFHRGKAEEPEMILGLVREAPRLLRGSGGLVLVAQRRLGLEEAFRGAFSQVSVRGEGDGFRVWEGCLPRWG